MCVTYSAADHLAAPPCLRIEIPELSSIIPVTKLRSDANSLPSLMSRTEAAMKPSDEIVSSTPMPLKSSSYDHPHSAANLSTYSTNSLPEIVIVKRCGEAASAARTKARVTNAEHPLNLRGRRW